MNLNPNPLHNKNKLLVIGFYNRENLGDEAYKIAFATHFIKFRLTFVCIDDLACISNSIDSFDGIVVVVVGGDRSHETDVVRVCNHVGSFHSVTRGHLARSSSGSLGAR
jgi:hypothetical protein